MGRLPFKIIDENFYECIEVSKQIFWMYYDIVSSGGIIHSIDFEQVNYEKYIMCEIVEKRLKTPDLEHIVELINQGCFTALTCHVLNLMDEDLRDAKVIGFIEEVLKDKKINEMEFERELLTSMLNALNQKLTYKMDRNKDWSDFPDGNNFHTKLNEVYKNYVQGYYESMLKGKTN